MIFLGSRDSSYIHVYDSEQTITITNAMNFHTHRKLSTVLYRNAWLIVRRVIIFVRETGYELRAAAG
jgi:exopolysaccharide biosynthesis protein